mmetsp:Transcript_93381/g.183044  ORF Transcript_93381/g.183044 Transcript_93381/m.183044 type:complete len:107 (-) Transcript_93381:2989-3309(-)
MDVEWVEYLEILCGKNRSFVRKCLPFTHKSDSIYDQPKPSESQVFPNTPPTLHNRHTSARYINRNTTLVVNRKETHKKNHPHTQSISLLPKHPTLTTTSFSLSFAF